MSYSDLCKVNIVDDIRNDRCRILHSGAASELGRQISHDPKTPGGPGSCSTIAEEAVDQLQENEKLVAGKVEILLLSFKHFQDTHFYGEWCFP